ncbi:MAG: transcriptional regulator, partial [Clostridia bacterium]|nr:transcriptional regulator [Clostridia bacterium]
WLMGFDVPIERGERDEENNPHHTKILMPNVTLGELIKQYRMNNNLTMDEFSKMSGLSKGYISMLERDEHPKTKQSIIPSFETLVSVSNAMNYDIDFLISILYSKQSTKLNDIHSASNIAERIQEIAHKKNMSLHTALDECNINRSLLSEMKSRNFYPRIDVILKLSEYFNCSVDYLTCRTDNPNERYNPSGKKAGTLAADEEQLLDNYNKLNPTGKDKVQDYTEDLTGNEKFTNTNLKPSPFSKSELPAGPEYQIAAWGGKETKGTLQPPIEEKIIY